jgi:hypothetical protein
VDTSWASVAVRSEPPADANGLTDLRNLIRLFSYLDEERKRRFAEPERTLTKMSEPSFSGARNRNRKLLSRVNESK